LRLREHRTAIAALLTAVGIIAPCAAWYVTGSRAASARAARLEETPRLEAREEATRLARRVALRLESMRASESRRPFQDYFSQDALVELQQDCTNDIMLPSPLAEGPVDPMIWAHFQIDAVGQLTLPTLLDNGAPMGDREMDDIQRAILSELECASAEHLNAIHRTSDEAEARQLPSPQGWIAVGPFSWHTATITGGPALVALREVTTPAAVLTQGFVVPSTRLRSLVEDARFPATVRPGDPGSENEALVPLQGDAWSVRVDAKEEIAVAAVGARTIERRFLRQFLLGSIAALIAGACLVLLVWKTERMAQDRARFAASAAHELRTPLAGLRLYGEMLAEGSGDPQRGRIYARRIADEAERLARVVANVMGFARLQREGLSVHASPGDLEPAVRSSIERLRPALESLGVPIELEIEGPVTQASFDPDALHQILQNLLDNASKFNREAADRTVRIRLSAPDDRPTLEVVDRGPGVPPELRRKLFRPFTHAPESGSPAGLGIGLAIVRALAEAQGAEVTFHAVEGGGAAFAVRFSAAG
jgi:signal transduction histidine kinase